VTGEGRGSERPRRARRAFACVVAAAGLVAHACSAPAAAQLRVTGEGPRQRLVREQFPQEYRARYDIFAVRCTRCHAMARPIAALTTGITPVSGGRFETDGIQRYVVRMMRKPNSGVDRADAREILLFLRYARGIARGEISAQGRSQTPAPRRSRRTEAR